MCASRASTLIGMCRRISPRSGSLPTCYSGGCVRLEDAARLGRWLFGRDLNWEAAGTEERVPLADPVPVYITYLTAVPEGTSIAYYDDVYGRDAARLATLQSSAGTVASAAK